METYNKSILEYDDVKDAVDYATERGIEQGIERGIEQGRIMTVINGAQNGVSIATLSLITLFSEQKIRDILKQNGLL